VILAGGSSDKFGQNKALLYLEDKPLVLHVLDKISEVVEEKMVVVKTKEQENQLRKTLKTRAEIIVDEYEVQTPLAGAYTGFKHAKNEYALLLSCDMPFISSDVARLLLECCVNVSAAISRSPEGSIEPLQAAFHAKSAAKAAQTALEHGELEMTGMIVCMRNVRYISTLVLRQLDPKLYTFFKINGQIDLKRAESLVKTLKT